MLIIHDENKHIQEQSLPGITTIFEHFWEDVTAFQSLVVLEAMTTKCLKENKSPEVCNILPEMLKYNPA